MPWMKWAAAGRSRQKGVAFPQEFDIGPGDATARVFFHDIETRNGPLSCWSYVTRGLAGRGQKEIILTIAFDPGEDASAFPKDPLWFLTRLNDVTRDREPFDMGTTITFDSRNLLFGRHVMFVAAQPLKDVEVPRPALAAILVTQEEAFAAITFGATRVTARLGFASGVYPCPPWSSRRRFGLSFERTASESLLARVPRKHITGARVVQEGARARIRCTWAASTELGEALSGLQGEQCLALLTDLDPSANGCFVWEPGQTGPEAITPSQSDGSRLNACFALFVPGQAENETRLIEDGVAFALTAGCFRRLHQALRVHETLTLDMRDGGTISVEIEE